MKPNNKAIRDFTEKEISDNLRVTRHTLAKLEQKKVLGELKNAREIRDNRKLIARLLTILTEKVHSR